MKTDAGKVLPTKRATASAKGVEAYDFSPPRREFVAREMPSLPWLMTAGGDLPDINVWLALAVEEHPHHAAAQAYWCDQPPGNQPPATLWFCRTTMLGLVRLLCQPKVVGKGALSLPEAIKVYQRFRALSGIGLLAEPTSCEDHLRDLVLKASPALPARLWTDAYLAALASSSGLRLVTFDRDFSRFALERCLVLDRQI